jgi:hypothetical protein
MQEIIHFSSENRKMDRMFDEVERMEDFPNYEEDMCDSMNMFIEGSIDRINMFLDSPALSFHNEEDMFSSISNTLRQISSPLPLVEHRNDYFPPTPNMTEVTASENKQEEEEEEEEEEELPVEDSDLKRQALYEHYLSENRKFEEDLCLFKKKMSPLVELYERLRLVTITNKKTLNESELGACMQCLDKEKILRAILYSGLSISHTKIGEYFIIEWSGVNRIVIHEKYLYQ